LTPVNVEHCGIINFFFKEHPDWNNECHIHASREWKGELVETEEMRPQWFPVHTIPYKEMWEDDSIWYPDLLAGRKLNYTFTFDKEGKLLYHEKH